MVEKRPDLARAEGRGHQAEGMASGKGPY